ncbi:right-handed parallel beta-helix repeat-containing protein [Chengkuizengella axinellae]|uniref:Right-handed parallel beta-helix repeat-containing protein n=1 Tax=Chengkuizengella axinellae TaxID=3064388 RepID=A0ABT9J179_9BACL|nr:right-handed parallel beta-helix repeat-containing protein [Chengkuizengella sp. 2205SS18-9]MDP5275352.1 right-handed parallel beta-helix repeat-containing protein [Chengkuizengella sp. 2205SS18-9]
MVINVPEDELTINAALGIASRGDTIRVAAITCNESIIISGANLNQIRIVGAGIGKTIINGTGLPAGSIGINILDSSLVKIENLSVRCFSGTGIMIESNENIIHKVEVAENGEEGISIVSNGSRNMIMSSEINRNILDGIFIINGSIKNYVVSNCISNNLREGIRVVGDNNLVLKNIIKGNLEEGVTARAANNLIINNLILNNLSGVGNNANDFVFANKIFKNKNDGIENRSVMNLYWANDIRCNGDTGIRLRGGAQHRVINNTIINSGNIGIEIVEGINDNLIDNNCIKNNVNQGILINPNSNDNVIRSNQLVGNTPDLNDEGMGTLFDANSCTTSEPPGLCNEINEIFVNEGESIQAAIDNVPEEGFTIRLGKGTFNESLTINNIGGNQDKIRIVGAGRGKTIIDGTDLPGETGIDIEASFITIENLTVQKFDSHGIRMSSDDNILQCVNTVDNVDDGILIEGGGQRNLIIHCKSSRNTGDSADGIDVNGNNNYIVCSQFKGNGDAGICLNGSFNLVFQNVCDGNSGAGITTTVTANENFIICNTAINQTGLDGFDIESDACLILWNKACGNMDDGFEVNNNSLVWGNVSANNMDNGIDVDGFENRLIQNIVQNHNEEGIIVFQNSDSNIVDNNKLINSKLAGILLESNDNAVRSNCLKGNNPDIQDSGMDNVIDENICQTSNQSGVCEDN